jgi:hypothetical protein
MEFFGEQDFTNLISAELWAAVEVPEDCRFEVMHKHLYHLNGVKSNRATKVSL